MRQSSAMYTDVNIGIPRDLQLLLERHVFIVHYLQKQINRNINVEY